MTLELFAPECQDNLLFCDGEVQDYGLILNEAQSCQYMRYFLAQLAWQPDEVFLHGKHYVTDRKVVWYGDENYQYRYSGSLKQAAAWNAGLFRLKQHIEKLTGHPFNSCLANLYEHGQQAVGWHSDDEAALISPNTGEAVIASLSFGAARKMRFQHKTQQHKVDVMLHSGQLIVMRGQTQKYWKHCIAKSAKIIEPRINLTFRYFFPV
ncbi:alpha-ketoglutarate-dependent dioxygenase AlkB family protein [Acinetobacter tianfuensis]|uniref:Alpha-ketoglutarate-dependent dioxygenase AlkB n=1 Tax=Acinetobacter tianfuensis TaxID=2419603 RepID=A0A3A8EU11_9GAMM|nr:alpha-ketoglutarate-dependent dioxygenase AlkB [Acinetobacter tianfuensis]RKG33494.1 alpha-ketoglutarate-dependent dioxygenase AlkB [Acinetobacter tianfuensis]